MGREAKGKGTEKEKVEKSKKITEDCFSTMRTVQGEKFGELDTSWCWNMVPTTNYIVPTTNLDR